MAPSLSTLAGGLSGLVDSALNSPTPRVLLLKNAIFVYVLIRVLSGAVLDVYDHGLMTVLRRLRRQALTITLKYLRRLPFVASLVEKEMSKVKASIEKDVSQIKEGERRNFALPATGMTEDEVKSEVDRLALAPTKIDVNKGRVSGAVYWGGEELTRLTTYVYERFAWTNPLHPDLFPGLRRMDAEIVAMVVRMYNGGADACGTTTSGGTESILMAVKAYRDWALEVKGITEPELVIPVTAHAAFDKACGYFNIKLYHVDVDEVTRKVDIAALRRLVNRNTIAIVGSAYNFPHGIIDDIETLGAIAKKNNIGLHVDCCLGGFIVPFMEKAGFPIAPFDFRVPGVTSISCDTHKYGFAPKGSSVIMYSSRALRRYQYFVAEDWTGGIYASPTIAGSRPGVLLAGCWATLMYMGEDGYIKSTRAIVSAAREIVAGLKQIDGVFVYGDPQGSVVGFGSKTFDIYRLSGELTHRGWNLNTLQYPASMHICCTYLHSKEAVKGVDPVKDFLQDVRDIVADIMKNPGKKAEGSGAMYGMAAAIPDRSVVDEIARTFVEALYIA